MSELQDRPLLKNAAMSGNVRVLASVGSGSEKRSAAFDCNPEFASRCDRIIAVDSNSQKYFEMVVTHRSVLQTKDGGLLYTIDGRFPRVGFWRGADHVVALIGFKAQVLSAIALYLAVVGLIAGSYFLWKGVGFYHAFGWVLFNSEFLLTILGASLLIDSYFLYKDTKFGGMLEGILAVLLFTLAAFCAILWLPDEIGSYEQFGKTKIEQISTLVVLIAPQLALLTFILRWVGQTDMSKLLDSAADSASVHAEAVAVPKPGSPMPTPRPSIETPTSKERR